MKYIKLALFALAFLGAGASLAQARGAGIEWDILNQEAMELLRAGKYDRAVRVAQKALQVAEQNVGLNHPDVAQSLNNLAELYRTQGDYARAEPLYKRSLSIFEKALGPEHPDVATSLENLAALYRATKRDHKAETIRKTGRPYSSHPAMKSGNRGLTPIIRPHRLVPR